ncbi:hypothetical protein ABAC460_23025 [Asticcacaulis sp. AC460]|uniref:hypothetical protein n=1 Tax=Asticcacaulis sp. AC460 TaxID=1282360 RepID=UPI0003C3E344|nr:hypothetical protein [Asticcacaulis sp. AC460]ESQ86589.1 hypothetical protein ABAC460_23025 [Asticcacaulis sp. AC460]
MTDVRMRRGPERRLAGRLAGILEAAVVRLGEDAADGLADLVVKLATVIELEAQVEDGQARALTAARSILDGTREMWREAPAAAVSRARCGALARAALVAVGEKDQSA